MKRRQQNKAARKKLKQQRQIKAATKKLKRRQQSRDKKTKAAATK